MNKEIQDIIDSELSSKNNDKKTIEYSISFKHYKKYRHIANTFEEEIMPKYGFWITEFHNTIFGEIIVKEAVYQGLIGIECDKAELLLPKLTKFLSEYISERNNVKYYYHLVSDLQLINGYKLLSKNDDCIRAIQDSNSFYKMIEESDTKYCSSSHSMNDWIIYYGNVLKYAERIGYFNGKIIHKIKGCYDNLRKWKDISSLDLSDIDFTEFNDKFFIRTFDFYNLSYLKELKFGHNLSKTVYFHNCPLSHKSVESVIEGLAKIDKMQSLVFSKETFNTLTEKDYKNIYDKGWTLGVLYEVAGSISLIKYNMKNTIAKLEILPSAQSSTDVIISEEAYKYISTELLKSLNERNFRILIYIRL